MDDDPVPSSASDTSGDPQGEVAISIRPKGKWATPEQWTAVRPTVKQLYMEENIPLKEVMSIMETQHNFYGTTKMYKNKLNEWGFFKTFKPREVLDALRILEDRREAGEQAPKIMMRGTEVDMDWIRGYIKRNKKRINKITRMQSGATDANGNRKILADMMTIVSGVASPDSSSIPTLALTSPEGIRQAEELLTSMNVYVDSAMSRNIWFIDCSGFYRSRKGATGTYYLYDFWDRLDTASQAMRHSRQVDLITLLNPAFSYLNDIIREEDPRSFPFLLGCFEVLRLRRRADLMETFLKYVWQLSSALLGSNYPHSRIWRQVYLMFHNGTHQDLIEQIFLLLMDRYHSQGTQLTLPAGVNSITPKHSQFPGTAHHDQLLEDLELMTRQQLEHIESRANCLSFPNCETQSPPPTTLLRRQGQYQEAEEARCVLQRFVGNPTTTPASTQAPHCSPDKSLYLRNLAETKLQQGDTLSAEHLYRAATHLIDNPSIYCEEGWVTWIFESLANVRSLQGKDRAAEWQRVKESRNSRFQKERAEYQDQIEAAVTSRADLKEKIKASAEGALENLEMCARAPEAGCPQGRPPGTCSLGKPVSESVSDGRTQGKFS